MNAVDPPARRCSYFSISRPPPFYIIFFHSAVVYNVRYVSYIFFGLGFASKKIIWIPQRTSSRIVTLSHVISLFAYHEKVSFFLEKVQARECRWKGIGRGLKKWRRTLLLNVSFRSSFFFFRRISSRFVVIFVISFFFSSSPADFFFSLIFRHSTRNLITTLFFG